MTLDILTLSFSFLYVSDRFGIGATICTCLEIQCLLYAVFMVTALLLNQDIAKLFSYFHFSPFLYKVNALVKLSLKQFTFTNWVLVAKESFMKKGDFKSLCAT